MSECFQPVGNCPYCGAPLYAKFGLGPDEEFTGLPTDLQRTCECYKRLILEETSDEPT